MDDDTPARPVSSAAKSNRLDALDGLRGVAAVLIVIYHFAGRWTERENGESLYPYGDGLLEAVPLINLLGLFGVSLFFLISGFVIIMTLERSTGLADFAVRRASRLWPTMIVCATLTTLFVSQSGIYLRFESIAEWEIKPIEYLSSIVFVDPAFTGSLLGIDNLNWVDGVYWTLWVEVRFYVLVAVVYWLASSERRFVLAWLVIQSVSVLTYAADEMTNYSPNWLLSLIFQPYYLSWFTLGICGFLYWKGRSSIPATAMAVLALFEIVSSGGSASTYMPNVSSLSHILLNMAVIATFALFLVRSPAIKFLENRWAISLGLASYPLYMFHERVGVIGMTAMNDLGIPPAVILPVMFIAVIGFAILMHRLMENPLKALILSKGIPAVKYLEKTWPALTFRRNKTEPT